MTRRRLVLVVAALLTVATLGFVAAALDDAPTGASPSGQAPAGGSGAPAGTDSGNGGIGLALVAVLVALAVGGIAYAAYRDSMPRWLVAVLVGSVAVLLLLVALGYVLDPAPGSNATATPTPEPVGGPDRSTPVGADSGGTAGGPLSVTETVALLALVVLGGALVVARVTGGSAGDGDSAATAAGDDAAAVGAAAGRAADELDETSLSNAVYRAWHEMTDALDVDDPETTTPAEFADAAVEAGLDRDDVDALTDLFREVRYGDAPVTAEREDRARETLRRIESAYAAAEGDPTADAADDGGADR